VVDLVLETKLAVPTTRHELVTRPRLIDRMLPPGAADTPPSTASTAAAALVLLSAPAGFGKSTLLTSFVVALTTTGKTSVAWVSLDARDRDARRFSTYLLHAIDRAAPGSGTTALELLESGHATEAVIASLLNELSVRTEDVALVLDDYHLADGPEVAEAITFLLERMPPQLQVVISTRADPDLPLARLRARGALVEIRAGDLRFTPEETEAYLSRVHGLELASSDVTALEARTEGWVAALQLAALSMRDRDDPAAFIAAFAGDDRFVVDYLADEVLDHLEPDVRDFLTSTSVLTRLHGPLCDAVTAGAGGAEMLQAMERRNLLIVPLDDQRRWYRYHHLFGDLLQARLLAARPADVPLLHARASGWYEQSGDIEAAVQHALAAHETTRAADLIEVAIADLRRQRRESIIATWIDQLPAEEVARRPVMAMGHVAALMAGNVYDGVAARMDALEQTLAKTNADLVVRDEAELARVPAMLATQRAGLALQEGRLDDTIELASKALALAPDGDHLTAGAAAALHGLAAWREGQLMVAFDGYSRAVAELTAAGHISDVLGCTVSVVDLAMAHGHLAEAETAARASLDLARTSASASHTRGEADMWVALGRVAWERGDQQTAVEHLTQAESLGEAGGLPQNPGRWRIAMARVREGEGNIAAADVLLSEAERLYNPDFTPHVRPVPAIRARLHARTGRLSEARAWVTSAGLTSDDDLTYRREYEHVTLARVLLAEHATTGDPTALATATALLTRLIASAQAGGRVRGVIELEVLQAVAAEVAGQRVGAEQALQRAAALAAPNRWLQVFVAEAETLRRPLEALHDKHPRSPFLNELLTAARSDRTSAMPTARTLTALSGAAEMFVEPLSEREREVLRLLASDLDGPGIARHLGVSLSTVRTHTQRIYTKLGVTNRRAAVRRGHQLNL
jgi:LuxR family maltose regulon positive regulatory protein